MPRSRSRSRSYERRRRSSRSRSRDYDRHHRQTNVRSSYNSRRDRSSSRDRHYKSSRDHVERRNRYNDDYSRKRHHRSRTRSKSKSKEFSRSSHSSSRDKKSKERKIQQHYKTEETTKKATNSSSNSRELIEKQSIIPELDIEPPSSSSLDSKEDKDLYRESFLSFHDENKMILTNIESEEDRIAIQHKMQEHLKRVFAAQGKVYPPPKQEKPLINAATGFANDGSFLEQFKKMQEYKEKMEQEQKNQKTAEDRLKNLPARRRGGKILKTGVVAKHKACDDNQDAPVDAWALYLKEVQKYKNASCDADSKTRPLVK